MPMFSGSRRKSNRSQSNSRSGSRASANRSTRASRGHEQNVTQACSNCRRYQTRGDLDATTQGKLSEYLYLKITTVRVEDIKFAYKFCLLSKRDCANQSTVKVCVQCKQVITADISKGSKKHLRSEYAWPAFFFSLLNNESIRGRLQDEVWTFIPFMWRKWWLYYARCLSSLGRISMNLPAPMLLECTNEANEVREALDSLEIVPLTKVLDKHCFYPSVKCPWGCSVFLPEATNSVPIDGVFCTVLDELNGNKFFISTPGQRKWAEGIRPDFLKKVHCTLYNKEWKVYPSIVYVEDKGPQMLCCGYHSSRSRGRYLHIPSTPFGELSSPWSDQMAQAVVQPRTLKYSKRKAYSNSFQMNKLQGGFTGVDSSTICDIGRFDVTDMVTESQEDLMISNRPDMKKRLQELYMDGDISEELCAAKLRFSNTAYPLERIGEIKNNWAQGSTFVDLNTAIALEKNRHVSDGRTIVVGVAGGVQYETHFKTPWPSVIVRVHAYGDKHGSRFESVPLTKQGTGTDFRLLWIVKTLLVHVQPIWISTNHAVKSSVTWHGWLMYSVYTKCLSHYGGFYSKNNPFNKKMNDSALHSKIISDISGRDYDPVQAKNVFSGNPDIRVVDASEAFNWETFTEDLDVKAVIFTKSFMQDCTGTSLSAPSNFIPASGLWECCYIITTTMYDTLKGKWRYVIYSGHGGGVFSGCWKIWRTTGAQNVCKVDQIPEMKDWDLCVFIRKHGVSESLGEQYLHMIGAQTYFRCTIHKHYLVTSTVLSSCECCTENCKEKVVYECPRPGCLVGICKLHATTDSSIVAGEVFLEPRSLSQGAQTNTAATEQGGNVHNDAELESSSDSCSVASTSSSESTGNVMSSFDYDDETSSNAKQNEYGQDETEDGIFDDGGISVVFDEDLVDPLLESNMVDVDNLEEIHTDVQNDLSGSSSGGTNSGRTTSEPNSWGAAHPDIGDPEDLTFGLVETDHLFEPETTLEDEEGDAPMRNTHSGRAGLCMRPNRRMIGLHVVFNKYLSLLVRYDRKLVATRAERNFMESIVSRSDHSLPLLYPEGLLFPSIFWSMQRDGSILGAMPGSMLADNSTVRGMGLATMYDQFRTRILNTELLTSTCSKYHFFAFDACLNLGMRGHDSRLILSRGFGEQHFRDGITFLSSNERILDTEAIDSRPVVNKLASAIGECMPTFFYTHTCSMKTHVGIRNLRRWLDSDDAVDACLVAFGRTREGTSHNEIERLRDLLAQSACSISVRSWLLISRIWMLYITSSSEKPIGCVTKFWYRFELQEKEANVSHIHSILWLLENDGSPANTEMILSRIRASIEGMVTDEEYLQYKEEGILSSRQHLREILDQLSLFLQHKHSRRCLVPRKGVDQNEISRVSGGNARTEDIMRCFRCKVPDNRMLSSNPNIDTFVYIELKHTKLAVEILESVGLATRQEGVVDLCQLEGEKPLLKLDKCLVARRHIPPTSAEHGIVSPVLAKLVIINPNSDNVQYLDSYGVSKYLAKYVASVDENYQLYITPPSWDSLSSGVNVTSEKTGNTKIASIKALAELKKKKKKKPSMARAMSQTEAIMLMCRSPQVHTNIEFIHIPTTTLEERPATERSVPIGRMDYQHTRNSPICTGSDIDSRSVIPSHMARTTLNFPLERQFLGSSLLLAKDTLLSPLSVDAITMYGVRPPELYFVKEPKLYFRWFTVTKIASTDLDTSELDHNGACIEYCMRNLKALYADCIWVDALSNDVKLRLMAVNEIYDYLQQLPLANFAENTAHRQRVMSLFHTLKKYKMSSDQPGGVRASGRNTWRILRKRFVTEEKKEFLPVIWFSPIKPTHTNRFLVHLLLSCGVFNNELELFQSGSIRNAFVVAQLLDTERPEESVKNLCKKYVEEQLVNMPGGTRQFDHMLGAAHAAIEALFIHHTIATDGTPPYLYTHLLRVQTEKQESIIKQWDGQVIQTTIRNVRDAGVNCSIPDLDKMMELVAKDDTGRVPQPWYPSSIPKDPQQSIQSFQEQQAAISLGEHAIKEYMNNFDEATKCISLVGSPGAGKTTVGSFLLLHAISHGLRCGTTSLLGERATELGGVHMHRLFSMVVRKSLTLLHQAELAVARLLRNSSSYLSVIKRLDVLLLDEMGQVSAETITVMDIILRRIRNSNRFMGGILIISTIDVLQLLPIDGRPPMLSTHMITSFKFAKLKYSVRSGTDTLFCELQSMTRLMPHEFTPTIRERFRLLVKTCCTFVSSFEDPTIPVTATYVFGKKRPGQLIHDKVVTHRKGSGEKYMEAISLDEELSTSGSWKEASRNTVVSLDKKAKEPKELYFFLRALYRITYNDPRKCFFQSQIAILMDLPTEQELDAKKKIKVYVCPPGKKDFSSGILTKEELLGQGWKLVWIQRIVSPSYRITSRLKGRRGQYGMRLHISSTTHACMGHTLSALVTKISMHDIDYQLWERAQAVVILSRTRLGQDTFFVGEPEETADALLNTLLQVNQYYQYMHMLMTNIVQQSNVVHAPSGTVQQTLLPFRARDILLPDDNTGVVYIIVSTKQTNITYIGETNNLSRRIDEHNTRSGSKQTASHIYQPWALLAYVAGFRSNVLKRKAFESQWKQRRDLDRHRLTTQTITELAKDVIQQRKLVDKDEELRFVCVQCLDTYGNNNL